MIRHDGAEAFEPEARNLREHLPFVGDARAEHEVECRDAIGGDNQELIAEVVDVSDLAVSVGYATAERGVDDGRSERQRDSSVRRRKLRILQGATEQNNNKM